MRYKFVLLGLLFFFVSCLKEKEIDSPKSLKLSNKVESFSLAAPDLDYFPCFLEDKSGGLRKAFCIKENGKIVPYLRDDPVSSSKDSFQLVVKLQTQVSPTKINKLAPGGRLEPLPGQVKLTKSEFEAEVIRLKKQELEASNDFEINKQEFSGKIVESNNRTDFLAKKTVDNSKAMEFRNYLSALSEKRISDLDFSSNGKLRNYVMDEGGKKGFSSYVHHLESRMIELEGSSDDLVAFTNLKKELTHLGKVRKEMEYSLENQVHMLNLWKSEFSTWNIDANEVEGLKSLLDRSIELKDSSIFLENFSKHSSNSKLLEDIRGKAFVAIARPVEDIGYQKMALGYDGKPVNMKGKSSKKTGFIPLDQKLSKLPGRYLDKLRKSNSSSAEIQSWIDELRMYQKKSKLGLGIIEENFLPTSVAKPLIRTTPVVDSSGNVVSLDFKIAVTQKLDLDTLTVENFETKMTSYKNGDFDMMSPKDLFENYKDKNFSEAISRGNGEKYIADLLTEGQFKKGTNFEVVRHHANPSVNSKFKNHGDYLKEFSNNKLSEFKVWIGSMEEGDLFAQLKMKDPDFSFNKIREMDKDSLTKYLGREAFENMRTLYNKNKIKTYEVEFAEFVLKKELGDDYSVTESDVEEFYMSSSEISADVDTWGKAQTGEIETNYNLGFKNQKSFFDFEDRKSRMDLHNVFMDYQANVLESSGGFTRLTKHNFEQFNLAFPQRALDDLPFSIQKIVNGKVEIIEIKRGPDGNPLGPFIEYLETLSKENVYLPLNPVDVIRHFGDYKVALESSPNMARSLLQYFDDFSFEAKVKGEGSETEIILEKKRIADVHGFMFLKETEIESAKEVYKVLKESLKRGQKEGKLSSMDDLIIKDMLKRLDQFLSSLYFLEDSYKKRIYPLFELMVA